MKTVKYTVTAPVLHQGVIVDSGEVELTSEQAERLIELGVIEVKDDSEAKAAEASKKEAEKQLKALRKKATELDIEGAAEKDAETLTAEIEAADKK